MLMLMVRESFKKTTKHLNTTEPFPKEGVKGILLFKKVSMIFLPAKTIELCSSNLPLMKYEKIYRKGNCLR